MKQFINTSVEYFLYLLMMMICMSLCGCSSSSKNTKWQHPKDFQYHRNVTYNAFVENGAIKKKPKNMTQQDQKMLINMKRDFGPLFWHGITTNNDSMANFNNGEKTANGETNGQINLINNMSNIANTANTANTANVSNDITQNNTNNQQPISISNNSINTDNKIESNKTESSNINLFKDKM